MVNYPPAEDAVYVLVPVQLNAFINHARPKSDPGYGDASSPRAYLSPVPRPNYNALKLESQLVGHDIFDHTRPRPSYSNGDPNRQVPQRSGIYLHWTLPRLYRTGLAASDNVDDFDKKRTMGGYPQATEQKGSQDTPIFREVPSTCVIMLLSHLLLLTPYRWIVCRTLTNGDSGCIRAHKRNTFGNWSEITVPNLQNQKTYFVVESVSSGRYPRPIYR